MVLTLTERMHMILSEKCLVVDVTCTFIKRYEAQCKCHCNTVVQIYMCIQSTFQIR
jgi:hypothetical protein